MLTKNCSLEEIAQYVEKDLKGFLDSTPERQPVVKAFVALRENLAKRKHPLAKQNKLSNFIGPYLQAVEDNGVPRKGSIARFFLMALRGWLRQFSLSSLPDFNMLVRAPRAQSFGSWVASFTHVPLKSFRMLRTLVTQSSAGVDLRGFPSWLILDVQRSFLFILCDDELICDGMSARGAERRYEVITFHEVAHARLHLEWLHSEVVKGQRQASATPVMELEAWMYSYSLLGLVAGLRARISRILGEPDAIGLL